MKQTSAALTFLMAQYRAIFKRAYIKGIAAAVMLTAGLAVSQAQAAPDPAQGQYYQFSNSKWSIVSGSESDVNGIVAGLIAGDKLSGDNITAEKGMTTVSGGVLTIGDTNVKNSLQTVTSGAVAGGWAEMNSGNASALNNQVLITGSGSVIRADATVGTRGQVIGGYASSETGAATASNNIVSVEKGAEYRNTAAATHGFMGGKAQGLKGATANKNKVLVKGAAGSLQTMGIGHLYDAVGGYVMTTGAPTKGEASGDYVANSNLVDLQYVKFADLESNDPADSSNDKALYIHGASFSVYTDGTINIKADQNAVKLTGSEIATKDNSSGTHIIAGVYNDTGATAGKASISFTNNSVTLADTKITNGSSFTGKTTVAGAYVNGLAPSITTTGNSVTLTESGTTNTLAIKNVAGSFINSTATANTLKIVATGNTVEVGENIKLTGDVAGASIKASGSALQSLNASNNSVTVKGKVTGNVAAVTYDKVSGALGSNVALDFSNNVVNLIGAEINSGSITGGAGLDSAINIDKDTVYNVTGSKDLASDVINIAGQINVEDSASLDISGFYQNGDESSNKYNANLTTVKDDAKIINSGTINVYGKMVVEDEAVLTAGQDAAAIIINGADTYQNAQNDEDVVPGAGFGHLVIAKDTLQGYLNGETHSGALILSDATLEFSGTEEIDLATDFTLSGGAATASGNGIITVSGSTIKGEYLKVSDTLSQVTKDTHGLVLEATNLTLGSNAYNKTASFGFESATAQNLTLQASGTFTLADDITLKAVTGTEDNYASSAGSINAKDVVISGGSLNVVAGDYSSATLL